MAIYIKILRDIYRDNNEQLTAYLRITFTSLTIGIYSHQLINYNRYLYLLINGQVG